MIPVCKRASFLVVLLLVVVVSRGRAASYHRRSFRWSTLVCAYIILLRGV